MANKFTAEEYLRAAEIMAQCTSKNIKFAVYFLKKAGMCDQEFLELMEKAEQEENHVNKGRKKSIDKEVVDALTELKGKGNDIYGGFADKLQNFYGIQKSRLNGWASGTAGITEGTKQIVMKALEQYYEDIKVGQEIIKKYRAAKMKAQHPEEPSP